MRERFHIGWGLLAAICVGLTGCEGHGPGPAPVCPVSLSLPFTGTCVTCPMLAPACELDLDFGNVPIGLNDSAVVQIKNTGSGALALSVIDGGLGSAFTFSKLTQSPLQPGSSTTATVTFQPSAVGQVSSTLSLATQESAAGPTLPVTITLTGNVTELGLVVEPNVLDFGSTPLYASARKSVMIVNRSTTSLVTGITATVIGSDMNLFAVDGAPVTLGAGESAVIEIGYSPLELETRSLAGVEFAGSNGERAALNLFGEPVSAALTLAPNPTDFGFVPPTTTAIACTTVSNPASVPVTLSGVSSFDADGAFAVAATDDATPPNPQTFPATPIVIAAGGNARVCFSFAPVAVQQYTGHLTLVSDDPSGSNPVVDLTGWGGGPEISCAPASIAFGPVPDGQISVVPVICTNTGSAIPGINLMIEPPTVSPDIFFAEFDETIDPYPLNGLGPGEKTQIDVGYAPTAVSSDLGTLFIKSNGGRGETLQVPLTAQGTN